MEGVRPPVVGARPALDPAALLEPVDETHDPARRQTDRLGDLALGPTLGERDEAKQHDFARLEPDAGEPLGPALR